MLPLLRGPTAGQGTYYEHKSWALILCKRSTVEFMRVRQVQTHGWNSSLSNDPRQSLNNTNIIIIFSQSLNTFKAVSIQSLWFYSQYDCGALFSILFYTVLWQRAKVNVWQTDAKAQQDGELWQVLDLIPFPPRGRHSSSVPRSIRKQVCAIGYLASTKIWQERTSKEKRINRCEAHQKLEMLQGNSSTHCYLLCGNPPLEWIHVQITTFAQHMYLYIITDSCNFPYVAYFLEIRGFLSRAVIFRFNIRRWGAVTANQNLFAGGITHLNHQTTSPPKETTYILYVKSVSVAVTFTQLESLMNATLWSMPTSPKIPPLDPSERFILRQIKSTTDIKYSVLESKSSHACITHPARNPLIYYWGWIILAIQSHLSYTALPPSATPFTCAMCES